MNIELAIQTFLAESRDLLADMERLLLEMEKQSDSECCNALFRCVHTEEAVFYIEHGGLLDDIVHPHVSDYPKQRIFIVRIEDYVYLVPYVETKDELFLKTIIPSRKFTKKYLGGGL